MDPNDLPTAKPTPPTATTPPTKKPATTPLPPRWRFVNDAKKAHGYSTADAGTLVPGLSAEELAAKYRVPDISEPVVQRRDVSVGRLDVVRPANEEEEAWPEGEFGGFRHREEEDMGRAERVARTWNCVSRGEQTASLGEPPERSCSESLLQERKRSLDFVENVDDCEKMTELEAGGMTDGSIKGESVSSCHSAEEQNSISQEHDSAQDREDRDSTAEDNAISLKKEQTSSPLSEDVVAQEVLLEKPAVCEDTDNQQFTTRQKRNCALLLFLLLACALALSLGILLGTHSMNARNQFHVVLLRNATNVPSASPSHLPSLSNAPSLLPSFDCPAGTKPFRVEIIREQNFTGWTQAEIFAHDATWTLREACSGDMVMECLPCQSKTRYVGSETRKNNLFEPLPKGEEGCLSSQTQYIFEVKASGGIGTCCGFAASTYVVTFDGNLIAKGETNTPAIENRTGALNSLNGETSDDLMEFTAYFGDREKPCLTSFPSSWPTRGSKHSTLKESMQPKPSEETTLSPSMQPIIIPTIEPTCSFTNKDFNLCFAIDMSGSVCNQDTGFECNSCLPALICNTDGVSLAACCSNFVEVVTFAKAMVTSLGSLLSNQTYSVVQFATNATLVTSLTSSDQALDALDQIIYTGGLTNHAEAIDACQETLQSSPNKNAKNLILLITDGDPSEPKTTSPEFAATQAAEEAKAEGSFIIPVMIAETLEPETMDYMKRISSDGSVFNVTDFTSLQMLQDSLITQVSCQT